MVLRYRRCVSGRRAEHRGLRPGRTTFLLTQVGSLAAARYAERIAPLGLTAPHAGLLRAIEAQPGRSQQAVAAELGLLPSRLVSLVDELERLNLVERRRNATDRRHYALFLTDGGRELLTSVGRVSGEHGNDFLAPLDADEREVLARLLATLAEHHGLTPGVHPGYAHLGRGEETPPGSAS